MAVKRIIIEGPDNAGKSTLAKKLSDILGWEIQHSGGPCNSMDDVIERMDRVKSSHKTIWDRVPCISEQIYGPILRHVPYSARTTCGMMGYPFADYVIIYCRPTIGILLNFQTHQVKSTDGEEHLKGIQSHAHDIIRAYDEEMIHYPYLLYDWSPS